jgi:AcrR family transcriptional regulator
MMPPRNHHSTGIVRENPLPQVKKAGMREAILTAAFDLFSRKGYTATPVAEIARAAGMTVANLYVYFPSKLAMLYEIYRPWLQARFVGLRAAALKYRSPRARLRRIFIGLWGDIPAADHCFANTLIEALAGAPPGTEKPDKLLLWSEEQLTRLLQDILPEDRKFLAGDPILANIVWMAFDGFAINRRIGDLRDVEALADRMTDLLLGASHLQLVRRRATPTAGGRAKGGRARSVGRTRKTKERM